MMRLPSQALPATTRVAGSVKGLAANIVITVDLPAPFVPSKP